MCHSSTCPPNVQVCYCMWSVLPGLPHVSTASDKRWGKKTRVRGLYSLAMFSDVTWLNLDGNNSVWTLPMSVFITAMKATTDQSRVFKVYGIVTQVVQEVSLHCRTVSFHDFITDHYGRSYIMHLYMYISIVHTFIHTISLVHSQLTVGVCYCVLKQYSMKSFHTMQNGFFIHVGLFYPRNWHYCLGILEKKGFDFLFNCVMWQSV